MAGWLGSCLVRTRARKRTGGGGGGGGASAAVISAVTLRVYICVTLLAARALDYSVLDSLCAIRIRP